MALVIRADSCMRSARGRRSSCRALRAAPGLLVLARGAAARLRLPADRPLLSRGVHASRLRAAALAARAGSPGRRTSSRSRAANDSGRSSSSPIWRSCCTSASSRSARRGRADAEDYFLAGRSLGPDRVPAVAVRHEHDGVLDPRRVGPRLRQRHRHLRADGVVVGAGHSRVPVRRSARGCGRSASATAS